jgi:hypothetical protein
MRQRVQSGVLAFTACALSFSPAVSEAARLKTETYGNWRVVGTDVSQLELGRRDGAEPVDLLGPQKLLEHRLRAGAVLKWRKLEFDVELDALNGLVNTPVEGLLPPLAAEGAPTRVDVIDPVRGRRYGSDLNSLALRKASLIWHSDIGQFAFGATTNHFGQGLLANDGGGALDAQLADQRFGDRVLRASYATKPLYYLSKGRIEEDVTSLVGLDLVLGDETASLVRPSTEWADKGALKDRAVQFVLALKHKRGGYGSGLFYAHRRLATDGSTRLDPVVTRAFTTGLDVDILDLFAEYRRPLAGGAAWNVAAEGAIVAGDATLVRNAACPGRTPSEHCTVLQGGGIARGGYTKGALSLDLLGGFASGDGNPFDATVTNFRFDRDFKVGLVLFDQVMAWQTAAMVRRAGDPALANVPAAGLELLSTSGAVTNALFVQPQVRWQLSGQTKLTASALWAKSAQGVFDPLWTNRTSALTGPFGQPAGRDYGVEFDVGLDDTRALDARRSLVWGLAAGHFLPGDAFATDAAGHTIAPVTLVKARAALVF